MPNPTQRRHFTRIPFDTAYRLQPAHGEQRWRGSVIDLSFKGALLHVAADFAAEPGEAFALELILGRDGLTINMQVKLAHQHEHLAGFVCEQIDLDSMTHLRRVLELNLGDPHLLERELNEMLQLTQP
jgi:hypothetical protein